MVKDAKDARDLDQQDLDQNEGEGSRTAALRYDEGASRFAASGKAGAAARQAQEALDGPEGPALRSAEQAGRARAAEEDPEVARKQR